MNYKMYVCNRCHKDFPTGTQFKKHNQRKTTCKPPSHFCSLCRKGFSSKRTLRVHKDKCMQKPGTSTEIDERIKTLKKKLDDFFAQLPGNFVNTLNKLELLLYDEEPHNTVCEIWNTFINTRRYANLQEIEISLTQQTERPSESWRNTQQSYLQLINRIGITLLSNTNLEKVFRSKSSSYLHESLEINYAKNAKTDGLLKYVWKNTVFRFTQAVGNR